MNVNPTDYVVWQIKEGPFSLEDVPEEYHPQEHEYGVYLVVMISPREDLEKHMDYELWFDSFDDAYYYKNRINRSMEPLNILGEPLV